MSIRHISQENVLHPFVVGLLETVPGRRLLDYGCGDGRILGMLNEDWCVDAYDPSASMRALAQARVGRRIHNLLSESSSIIGPYDVVLFGMVLLCIPTKEEVHEALSDCAGALREGGRLILTTSHPCFRNQTFSNFSTEFSGDLDFEYVRDGLPFEVTIRDPDGSSISFVDYHWTLEFTFASLKEAGFEVTGLSELGDDSSCDGYNPRAPAFLVLDCVRTK